MQNYNSKFKIKKIKITKKSPDVISHGTGKSWIYSGRVKEHFYHPKNFLQAEDKKKYGFNGIGMVGSPACGDQMKFWIKVNLKTDKIETCKWQTFGCASAIASTSILSVMVTEEGGMKVDEALKIKPLDILKRLGGLPSNKIHCSVLGDKALRAALNDYFRKSGQYNRVVNK